MKKKKGVNKIPMIRKVEEKRPKIKFEFEDEKGKKYSNGTGRIKICAEGFLTLIIKDENDKWKNIKGKLKSLKVIQVPKTKRA